MDEKTYYLIGNRRLRGSEMIHQYIFNIYTDLEIAREDMRRLVTMGLAHDAIHQSYNIVEFVSVDHVEFS